MHLLTRTLASFFCLTALTSAYAAKTVQIDLIDAKGKTTPIGTITMENTAYGLLLTPNLNSLPPGLHGFHVHEHPNCTHEGMDAGSHLDPAKTGKHLGPYDDSGHLGDLPVLYVDAKGNATVVVLAPKLTAEQLDGRALMIHEGGDNYSDKPKLGGGGNRIACGVVK